MRATAPSELALPARGSLPAGSRPAATRRLNLKSHIPLYIQLTEILKERIESGEWQPGGRFASEGEIGAEFGVSRAVVRPAIGILVNDGQLVKHKGRGVFVAPKKVVYRIDGLVRSMLSAGSAAGFEHVRNRIIDSSDADADERLAGALDISADDGVVAHVMSVVEVSGRPIGIRDSYISPVISEAVAKAVASSGDSQGPFSLPGRWTMEQSEVEVEVSSASPFEADWLGISAGAPTILVTYRDLVRTSSASIVPVEFARMVYRSDITSFRFGSR